MPMKYAEQVLKILTLCLNFYYLLTELTEADRIHSAICSFSVLWIFFSNWTGSTVAWRRTPNVLRLVSTIQINYRQRGYSATSPGPVWLLFRTHSKAFRTRFNAYTVARRASIGAHKHAVHQQPADDAGEVEGHVTVDGKTADWTKDGQPTARRQACPYENTRTTIKDVGRLGAREPLKLQGFWAAVWVRCSRLNPAQCRL